MNWKEFQKEVHAAGVYNIKTLLGWPIEKWKNDPSIPPANKNLALMVLAKASELGKPWKEVLEEMLSPETIEKFETMGGTDHPDPTLHSSPIASER